VNLPAEYARAGVTVLFGSSGTTGAAWLPATVAHAVSRGLGPGTALAGLTWDAADRLGVGDRTGRIAPGRTADLVVLSGPPFVPGTRVIAVIRGGRVVYEERGESR
jgi:imidazolonepropionase-like amidohydrolase